MNLKTAKVLMAALIFALVGLWIAAPVWGSGFRQTADDVEVVEIIEFPLQSGPGRTGAYLAPDGNRIAYLYNSVLCVFEIEAMADHMQLALDEGIDAEDALGSILESPEMPAGIACVLIKDKSIGKPNPETIRWSPDGRYLALTEGSLMFLMDSDIWVVDTSTLDTGLLALANLTDDGDTEFDFSDWNSDSPPIDILPRWLPDGRIVFLRYVQETGADGADTIQAQIYTIQPDGSDLQQMGQLAGVDGPNVSSLSIAGDGTLAYNLVLRSETESLRSIWISDLDGSNARQVWQDADDSFLVPHAVEWSPDGEYIAFSQRPGRMDPTGPEASVWRAVHLSDGETVLFSPDQYVSNAGWAPDGSAIIYTTIVIRDRTQEGLYIAAELGAPGRMLVPAHPDDDRVLGLIGPTSVQWQMLAWNNNTVLASRGDTRGLLVIRLAVP